MNRCFTFFLSLAVLLIARLPVGVFASEFQIRYVARLSAQDHFNSKGHPLRDLVSILRQDRANFHTGRWRDPEDEPDPFFSSAAARAVFEGLPDSAVTIDSEMRRKILSGVAVVRVEAVRPEGSGLLRIQVGTVVPGVEAGAVVSNTAGGPENARLLRAIRAQYQSTVQGGAKASRAEGKGVERPGVPSIRLVEGEVTARTGLNASCGAFVHDGKKALFETAPGLLELWDLGANLRLRTFRATGGRVLAITRAQQVGSMLVVCVDTSLRTSVLLVPTEPGQQPKLLWWANGNVELAFGRNDYVPVERASAGSAEGELMVMASLGNDSAGGSQLLQLHPEVQQAEGVEEERKVWQLIGSKIPGSGFGESNADVCDAEMQHAFNPIAEFLDASGRGHGSLKGLRFQLGADGRAVRVRSPKERAAYVMDEWKGKWLTVDVGWTKSKIRTE